MGDAYRGKVFIDILQGFHVEQWKNIAGIAASDPAVVVSVWLAL